MSRSSRPHSATGADSKPPPPEAAWMSLSRSLRALLAGIYLWVGLAFCYLYRHYGGFPVESMLWVVWTALCFVPHLRRGMGPVHPSRGLSLTVWSLALFQIFLIDWFRYSMLPWVTVSLLVVVGARAGSLCSRRDLYLALVAVFVASLMIATHFRADWSLWFYLAPAWFLAVALLVWEHADSEGPGWRLRLGASVSVTALAVVISAGLLAILPHPDVLDLGLVPSEPHAGSQGPEAGLQGSGGPASSSGGAPGSSDLDHGPGGGAGRGPAWLADLKASLDRDPHMPRWQAQVLRGGLAALGAVLPALEPLLVAALAALLAWMLGRLILRLLKPYLERLLAEAALVAATLLARRWPMVACRCAVHALSRSLNARGLPALPGESVLEHCSRSHAISHAAYPWALSVARRYGSLRFSACPATTEAARTLEFEAASACEALWASPKVRPITSPRNPSSPSPG